MATTKALIFAGAGASKAVNAEQYPTTVEFFQKLPDAVTSDTMFGLAEGFLKQTNASRTLDIEEVLWELQEFLQFTRRYNKSGDFLNYLLKGSRIAPVVGGNGQNFAHFDAVMSRAHQLTERVVGLINEQVYDFYASEPSESELKDNWLYLFEGMRRERWSADVFTTNYDLIIETAALFDPEIEFENFVGQRGLTKKRLNLEQWMTAGENDRFLTKLHGSIDWQYVRNEIYIGSPVYTGNHNKHAIIYPGFKGMEGAEFFRIMHAYLGRRIQEADVCVFIGFAFRDDYVNRLLADRIRPDCRFVVVNPDKNLEPPYFTRGGFKIAGGFDRKSVDRIFSG